MKKIGKDKPSIVLLKEHREEVKRNLLERIFILISENEIMHTKESVLSSRNSANFSLTVLDNQERALKLCMKVLNDESPLSELTKLYNDRNKTADGVQYQHTLFGRITSGLWNNDVIEMMKTVLSFTPQPNPTLPLLDSTVNRM